jgi:hypothetical protein
MIIFHCSRCDRTWAEDFGDERPILWLPFKDPYRSKCKCGKTGHGKPVDK